MHRPPEDILQYVWRHRLLLPGKLKTANGTAVRIISPGAQNKDAGPDFFNAQLEIGGILLSGNVEIHVRTSDWTRHRHETDRSYDHIILHVVYEHDGPISQNTDHHVEVLELRHYIPNDLISRYESLAAAPHSIPCHKQLAGVDDHLFAAWLERMALERIGQKQKKIEKLLFEFHGDYAQTLYAALLSAYGFSVNTVPFELLARHLPLHLLLRHSDHLLHVEALLAGMAGLLSEQLSDPYMQNLQNEFVFLRRKYGLFPLRRDILKFSKMRPANFPGLRLAQLAALIHKHPRLFSDPLEPRSRESLLAMLRQDVSVYWKHHYNTSGSFVAAELRMGAETAERIIVNVFAPFYFFCGKKFGKEPLCSRALELLEQCGPENNHKTRLFSSKKHLVKTSLQSQALITLADTYCAAKQCLRCGVGTQIINGKTGEVSARTHHERQRTRQR